MSESEYPLARAVGIRRARGPVGPWLFVCVTAGLLLQGAGDGSADRSGRAASGPGATVRDASGRAVSNRVRLPSDRVLVASPEVLGAGQSPDIWSTPLALRGGTDADPVATDEATALARPAEAEAEAAKDITGLADPRFSHASLIDLGRGPAVGRQPGIDRIAPEDLPTPATVPVDTRAAPPPAVTASVDDAAPAATATVAETHSGGPAASVTGSIADAAPPRAATGAPQPATPSPRLTGRWAPAAEACAADERRSSYIPLTIDARGAKAGDAKCRFGALRPSGERSWNVAASCSSGAERWTSNVKLTLVGKKLTWKSARGTQTYLRCG